MTIAVISMIRESWGGSEELWTAMASEALKKKHTIIHLAYKTKGIHPKIQKLIKAGLIAYYRPGYFPKNIGTLQKKMIIAANYLRKKIDPPLKKIFYHRPDIVLYNGTCYSIAKEGKLLYWLKNQKAKLYILGHYVSENEKNPSAGEKRYLKDLYQYADRSFFVAEKSLSETRNFLSMELPNATIVRNPVNIPTTDAVPFQQNKTIQFATVGNLICVHKGQDILLNVLASEKWKQRNWHLNIYGSGADENFLKQLVDKNQLHTKISFHGKVNDIRSVWQLNNILLMPSRMEGMPLAVVEAMLCGRPVVATNAGGITEWVEEDKEGFIAEIGSVKAFDEAMECAWKQRDRWDQLGKNAHAKAMRLYDPHAGKTLLELITG